jgi:hypothetical protein
VCGVCGVRERERGRRTKKEVMMCFDGVLWCGGVLCCVVRV